METEIVTAESVNIDRIKERSYSRLELAQSLVISTPEDVATADAILVGLAVDVQTAKLALKPMRDGTTAAWKAGTELENRLVKPLEEAKKALAVRRGEAVDRIRSEALEAQAAAMDSGDFDNLPAVPEIAKTGVTSKEVWTAEIVDLGAFQKWTMTNPGGLVYWEPNQKALDLLATANKGVFVVPGVRAVKSFSSTVRTGPAKPYIGGRPVTGAELRGE